MGGNIKYSTRKGFTPSRASVPGGKLQNLHAHDIFNVYKMY